MKKRIAKKSLLFLLVFLVASCVTINIYFPEAAVEKAADEIVDEVWGEEGNNPQEKEDSQKSEPESLLLEAIRFAISVIGPEDAYAQDADINVTTPAIRAIKQSIQDRAPSIKPFMDGGNVGITNDGLLAILNSKGVELRQRAVLSRTIAAENADRNALYAEIAKANQFPASKIDDIKKIFAGSWIKQAKEGWMIQAPDGQWGQK